MTLDLNLELARELKAAVDARVTELRDELAHTDQRELKHSVRVSLDRLEEVQRRLNAAFGAER